MGQKSVLRTALKAARISASRNLREENTDNTLKAARKKNFYCDSHPSDLFFDVFCL